MNEESQESLEAWLHRLEWSQLLSLQRQLINEMDRRYVEETKPGIDQDVKEELSGLIRADLSSFDDLPSTQLDPIDAKRYIAQNKRKNHKSPSSELLIDDPKVALRQNAELLSSPLKENEFILDSQTSDILKEHDVNVQKRNSSSIGKPKRTRSPNKLKMSPTSKSNKKTKTLVDFNVNPMTKKPWIYEDFKTNELVSLKDRKMGNKKSSRVARFHAQAGSPIKHNHRLALTGTGLVDTDDMKLSQDQRGRIPDLHFPDDSFENFRVRSKSPPGYGRLNFPTTQERIDDKEESKKLLFQKTKERFMEATNNLVPIAEREFYFKNSKLNDLVDDGSFAWNIDKLQIFTR